MSKHHADRISKVYFNKGKTTIVYEHNTDECAITSKEPPHPEFIRAFAALGDNVVNILEVVKRETNPVRPYQVTVRHVKERKGYQVSAMITLRNSPQAVTLTTPLKWDGHKDPKQALDEDELVRMEALMTEARRFLDGKRGQGNLFGSGDGAGSPEDAHPEPDWMQTAQALVAAFGDVPEMKSVGACVKYFRENLTRLEGWKTDGSHSSEAMVHVGNHLLLAFNKWRDIHSPTLSTPEFKKVEALTDEIGAVMQRIREATVEETPTEA